MKYSKIYTTITALVLLAVTAIGQESYQNSIETWRKKREANLKTEDGWLAVAGLFWLKEGTSRLGAGAGNDLVLPKDSAPESVGTLTLRQGAVTLAVNEGVIATTKDGPVKTIEMKPDATGEPTFVSVGDVKMLILKRGERYGLRVWDKNSPARRGFKGLQWYPVDESYRVTARLVPHAQPRQISVPNVLGDTLKMPSPGVLHFKLNGREYTLEPVKEDDGSLFIIFRDATSGKGTYGAGRFLYADAPVNGLVTLDFNKAYNPPCAFTHYATCPLPPRQNRLAAAVKAGELDFHLPDKVEGNTSKR